MKALNTTSSIMASVLRKGVKDFLLIMGGTWAEPDWKSDLRCEWDDTTLQITHKDEWLIEIDGRHLFWCRPVDPSDLGAAVATITSLLTRYDKAAALARKYLGP